MANIIIDGKEIECRDGIPVLQAALEAGWDVPHYCYHPGLAVVASCRLCLMEMKLPHPQTKELGWAPKMFPSCQTPVKDGMEVRFASEKVKHNQQHCLEYYLLNHPLDCPVCDKAGECYLQDYSYHYGNASSRMVEDKYKNPKKDIGSHTLLYQDRCVMCTRCVRFADEVAGAGELRVVNRGSRAEIDVFPGEPLENELQGNVVDLCPVGALLDKDFLFKQRVWLLKPAKSISPFSSGGENIYIDQNNNRIWRIRPRFNEKANEWWISDETRFGWKFVHDEARLSAPRVRDNGEWTVARWEDIPEKLRFRFQQAGETHEGSAVAAVLSPFMSNEEAWLLAKFIRTAAPQAALVLGPVPSEGEDTTFPKGFVIRAEKAPNRKGVEKIIGLFGGPTASLEDFIAAAGEGKYNAAYLMGGYHQRDWAGKDLAKAVQKIDFVVTHDLFESGLEASAAVQLPAASWAEREGTWMNCDGLLQLFERALLPLEGVKPDGQFFAELAGVPGLYRSARIREMMAEQDATLNDVFQPRPEPKYAH